TRATGYSTDFCTHWHARPRTVAQRKRPPGKRPLQRWAAAKPPQVATSPAASACITRDGAPRCHISATAALESARERGCAARFGVLFYLLTAAPQPARRRQGSATALSRVWADWQRSVLTHRVAERILCAADRVLHFAGHFLRLAFAFGLGIARDL